MVELHFHLLVCVEYGKCSYTVYVCEEEALRALRAYIRASLKIKTLRRDRPLHEIVTFLKQLDDPDTDYKEIVRQWRKYNYGRANCTIYPVSLTLE